MPKVIQRAGIKSCDTETTGLDRFHGAKPFFVTVKREELDHTLFWQADVDPLTREPQWSDSDLTEIRRELLDGGETVFQNAKFDVGMLETILLGIGDEWPWERTHETLYSGHLLNSNQPHDLTTMSLVYLGVNIKPLEEAIKQAATEARRLCRTKDFVERHGQWAIAHKDRPDMPSCKESAWGFDMWLPRAVAKAEWEYSEAQAMESPALINLLPTMAGWEWRPPSSKWEGYHPWWTVLEEYSNADSEVTLPLHVEHRRLLEERGLWKLYVERLKMLPIVYGMEHRGITLSRTRLEELQTEYTEKSEEDGKVCVNIAASYGHELTLPKSGSNNSLREFVFGSFEVCGECSGDGKVFTSDDYIATDSYTGQKYVTRDTAVCSVCKGTGEIQTNPCSLDLRSPKTSKKSGEPSFDKSVLEHFLATLPEKSKPYSFIKRLQGKRSRDTALGYMESYQRYWLRCNHQAEEWMRMHSSLNPTGTDTLRWSSQGPNEQQISKKEDFNLRYMFGPLPGREWWSLDYDNLELRVPAYECGEQLMIDIFEKPDDAPYFGSYHLMNASIVYPDLFWPLADQKGAFKKKYAATWYQWIKNFGFAVGYGAMVESGTADRAAHKPGAQRMVMDKLKNIARLNQQQIAYAERHGYVETIPDQEIDPERGYPLNCQRTRWGQISPTIPLNYHVQGTACWVMMRAMFKVQQYLDQHCPEAVIVMNIHDELVFDFPFSANQGNRPHIEAIRGIMGSLGDCIGVKLTCGVNYCPNNWAEAA